jgi:hypothetical protein
LNLRVPAFRETCSRKLRAVFGAAFVPATFNLQPASYTYLGAGRSGRFPQKTHAGGPGRAGFGLTAFAAGQKTG